MSYIEDLTLQYPDKVVLVDTSVANKTYVGISDPGAPTAEAKWIIFVIDATTATAPVQLYPLLNGFPSAQPIFSWDIRTQYTYSQDPVSTQANITTVTIETDNATNTGFGKESDTIHIQFVSDEALLSAPHAPVVTVNGVECPDVESADGLTWDAYVSIDSEAMGITTGEDFTFTINAKVRDGGVAIDEVTATTDTSAVTYLEAPTATLEYSKDAGSTWSSSIAVKDADTLKIRATFSHALKDSPVVKLAINNAVLSATNMTKVSTTVYTYDLNVPAGNIATATCSLSVGIDDAGNAVTTAPTNATFEIDNTAPTLSSAVRLTDTRIEVNFSDYILNSSITKANAGGFTVTKTGTGTTYAVTAVEPGTSLISGYSKKAMLTVTNMEGASLAGVTVKYTSGGNGTVTDDAGNSLATDGTGVVIPAW